MTLFPTAITPEGFYFFATTFLSAGSIGLESGKCFIFGTYNGSTNSTAGFINKGNKVSLASNPYGLDWTTQVRVHRL